MLKLYKVNEAGMEMIRQFVLANHKRPEEATTDHALTMWASNAEIFADLNDGQVIVEIPADECIHGNDVGLVLDESCVDTDTISEIC